MPKSEMADTTLTAELTNAGLTDTLTYEDAQRAIAQTLLEGPSLCPNALFAGAKQDYLRGLRVHANTISHARLVALEDNFPKTRGLLGEALFNRLSRDFLDEGGASGEKLMEIGSHFPMFLRRARQAVAAGLAEIERAWLLAFHAADARPLALGDLGTLDEEGLLALRVERHPSVQLLEVTASVVLHFDPELPDKSGSFMLYRPEAEVYGCSVSSLWRRALEIAAKPTPLGRILEVFAENVQAENNDKGGKENEDGVAEASRFIAAATLVMIKGS